MSEKQIEIEKRIYSGWAFSKNELEKRDSNKAIFKELHNKYKIYRNDCSIDIEEEILNDESYDVIIGRKAGYNHAEYIIYRNKPQLDNMELALLCDNGNLCFGFNLIQEETEFYIFED